MSHSWLQVWALKHCVWTKALFTSADAHHVTNLKALETCKVSAHTLCYREPAQVYQLYQLTAKQFGLSVVLQPERGLLLPAVIILSKASLSCGAQADS